MKPLRDFVLIEKISEEITKSGIVLPKDLETGVLCTGTVVDVGPLINPSNENISIGSKVYYLRDNNLSDDNKEFIVHMSKILAVDDESIALKGRTSPIEMVDWEDYKTEDYDGFWKELTNFRNFVFSVKYLKPFVQIINFQKEIYEAIVQNITLPHIGSNASIELGGDKDADELIYTIDDDTYGGILHIDKNKILIDFRKDDLQSIMKKLPCYLEALTSISNSPAFNSVFGKSFNRVSMISFNLEQVIRIVGKGRHANTPVNNKEIMQRIVNLGKSYKSKDSVIDCLSPIADSIGRVDLTFSIERQIAGHQYTIFIKLQAPTNQDSSYLYAEVDIQDRSPGHLSQRNYTPILTEFLRDAYFESFLKELFNDIFCTTLGSK